MPQRPQILVPGLLKSLQPIKYLVLSATQRVQSVFCTSFLLCLLFLFLCLVIFLESIGLHDNDNELNICLSILVDIRLRMMCWRPSSASSMSRMASSSSRIWCLMRTLTDSGDHLETFFFLISPLMSIHIGLVNAICVCSTGRSLSAFVDRKWRFPVWWWWETWPSSIQSLSPTRKPCPNCRTSRKIRNCSATALYHRCRTHWDGPVTEQ